MRTNLSIALPLLAAAAGAGCKQDEPTVVFVTVDARPTVRAATTLHVEVANAGAMRSQDFALPGGALPVTFTVTPGDRTGDLTITAFARDAAGTGVARGEVTGAIADGRTDLALTLDPDDFSVNSAVADYQWITYFEDFTGRQVAAAADGSFVVTWENSCPLSRCDIFARLFGPDTLPDVNGTSVSEDDFIVQLTDEYTESPAIAAGAGGYLLTWMGMADGATARDVKAVALAPDAAHLGLFDTSVTTTAEDEQRPTTLARADGTYVVVWEHPKPAPSTDVDLRARVLDSEGNATGAEFGISAAPTGVMSLPHGAGLTGGGFVVVWAHTGAPGTTSNVRARAFDAAGQPTTAVDILVSSYPAATVFGAHTAQTSDGGFVVAWQAYAMGDAQLGDAPLRMRRFAQDGDPLSTEIEVVPETLDLFTVPAIAARGDGAIGVTWHDCVDRGDGSECGIRFRLFHPGGLPAGDDLIVNTTTVLSQRTPSIVAYGADAFLLAWTDGSMLPPDSSATGVRARVIYPGLVRRDGAVGARCGGPSDAPCGGGLECAASVREQTDLCHPTCTAPDGTECVTGGTCTAGVCLFE